ncbi:MAG TPA: efflux RND transporter periplasmic adaptor subunit [Vicinamibacterales bacterium]|nr:efflux RND transporter periplasmic adaptor subunit [Vicinamibacterales bacterium]
MTRKKKILIGTGVVVVLGAVAFANFRFKRADGVSVNVESIQQRNLESVVSASGKIQPKRSVNISADTMGRVTTLAVNEGDTVTRGQFLLEIDPRNLRTRVESGEASLSASASQLEQLRISLEATRVNLKAAQDTFSRQQELWKGGLTTREALERAENELKAQQANLRAQEQNLKTQELRIQQERASLSSAKYDLSRVRIESPINGIVTRRNIEEGETAVTGTMNNPGTVLLTIADMSVLEAEVEVDETDIPTVRIGQPAKVTIDALPGRTFTAKVTEIGNSPIQASGAAAAQATNFKVVLTLDEEVPNVRPGFTCTAEITTATRENVLAVPIQATTVRELVVDEKGEVVRDPARPVGGRRSPAAAAAVELAPGQQRKELEGVFVVVDGKAQFVPVKTGIAGDKYFEVLSGLKAGDQVIVGPFSSVRELREGAPVQAAPAARSSSR